MGILQLRISNELQEQIKKHCGKQNKTVSEYIRSLVATDLNDSVATKNSVATDIPLSVATTEWIEFNPRTGEPINHSGERRK